MEISKFRLCKEKKMNCYVTSRILKIIQDFFFSGTKKPSIKEIPLSQYSKIEYLKSYSLVKMIEIQKREITGPRK